MAQGKGHRLLHSSARANRIKERPFSRRIYKKRHLIENFFEKIKRYRRVATRFDMLSETYFGFACLSAAIVQVT